MDEMGRILVVDDDALILYSLSRTLKSRYPDIKTVADGESALEEFRKGVFDLCLLDFFLPGINGLEVMKKIKEISPRTKVVIMTAGAMDAGMRSAIEEGAFHFIEKPFDLSEVIAVAGWALNGHAENCPKGKRRGNRSSSDRILDYSVVISEHGNPKRIDLQGVVVDVNDFGIGMRTSYPHAPGHLLTFHYGAEHKAGIVKWNLATDNNTVCRIGVEFVKAGTSPTEDSIDRPDFSALNSSI
ncbi:MAG: response regulator [Acidobacteriaceae bacterium]